MASRLVRPLIAVLVVLCSTWSAQPRHAVAAGLDDRGESEAKEASQLYKQGRYEEAASIFAKLSVDYPEMVVFERNLGACFYYLRKPDPALSNLRRYLSRKKNITPDDKAIVDRWIDEMEKLRAQNVPVELVPNTPSELPAQVPVPLPVQSSAPLSGLPEGNQGSSQATPAPAGVDVSTIVTSSETTPKRRPFYKTWWFWGGVTAVVAAGTATAVLLTRGEGDACGGASHPCVGVK